MHDMVTQTQWDEQLQQDVVIHGLCSCGWESDDEAYAAFQVPNHLNSMATVEMVELG